MKAAKRYFIYSLTDPITGELYYVGNTTCLTQRKAAHCSLANCTCERYGKTPVYQRNAQILRAGQTPQMEILDEIVTYHHDLALRIEQCYMLEMRHRGRHLLNQHDTGRCNDRNNPMEYLNTIRQYAMVSEKEYDEFIEWDFQEAVQRIFA